VTSLPEFLNAVDPRNRVGHVLDTHAAKVLKIKAHYSKTDSVKFLVLLEVTRRYLAMIRVDQGRDWNEDRFGDKTSVGHIKWMLEELESNMEQSITKKHRWLGFIQGLLIAYGFTTVDREREMTRELFRGD
jgi:hypothetical protein